MPPMNKKATTPCSGCCGATAGPRAPRTDGQPLLSSPHLPVQTELSHKPVRRGSDRHRNVHALQSSKPKTAYAMESRDWSSVVCSSDLTATFLPGAGRPKSYYHCFYRPRVRGIGRTFYRDWDKCFSQLKRKPCFLHTAAPYFHVPKLV